MYLYLYLPCLLLPRTCCLSCIQGQSLLKTPHLLTQGNDPSLSYVICLFPLYFLILTSIQTCHLFCFFNLLTPHALPDISPHFFPSSELPGGLRYSLVSLSPVLSFSTEVLQSGCCSQDTGTRDLQIVNSINCSSSSYVTHL